MTAGELTVGMDLNGKEIVKVELVGDIVVVKYKCGGGLGVFGVDNIVK